MIKLICTDVDGTLVPDGTKDINPELLDTLLALKRKGIHVTIASGRPVSGIRSLFKPIENDLFFIALSGGIIATSKRTLFRYAMDQEDLRAIVRQMKEREDCDVLLQGEYASYVDTRDDNFYNWVKDGYGMNVVRVSDLRELLEQENDVVSVSIYHRGHRAHEALQDFIDEWSDRYKMVTAGTMWLDVLRKDVNKGNAVAELQDALEITPEETMVFGDQRNDIDMMYQAVHSYAVGNAVDELKAAARYTIGRVEENAVLQVLRTLL